MSFDVVMLFFWGVGGGYVAMKQLTYSSLLKVGSVRNYLSSVQIIKYMDNGHIKNTGGKT